MHRSNIMHLNFSKAEDFRPDDNLHINFIFYSNNSASTWYTYQKRITVMHKSELLINVINEKNILHTTVKIANLNRSLYYENSSDNVYGNIAVDIYESYHLHPNYYDYSLEVKANPKKNSSKSIKYIDVKKPLSLEYYDPNISEYRIYPLDNEMIDFIGESYTYEQLIESGKLLEEDIRRLENLDQKQIRKLIDIHNNKEFYDLEL